MSYGMWIKGSFYLHGVLKTSKEGLVPRLKELISDANDDIQQAKELLFTESNPIIVVTPGATQEQIRAAKEAATSHLRLSELMEEIREKAYLVMKYEIALTMLESDDTEVEFG